MTKAPTVGECVGQRRAEHHTVVPASPMSIVTRSCPSPPNHSEDLLGSTRESENWQKITLLCHPCFRQLPRLRYLNTSTHQKGTVWVSMGLGKSIMNMGLGKSIPKMYLPQPKSPTGTPTDSDVLSAPCGTSRSSLPFAFVSVCKVSPPKGTEFPKKTFLWQRDELWDKGIT